MSTFKEIVVSFETAKLAQEKGFAYDEDICDMVYLEPDGKLYGTLSTPHNLNKKEVRYQAPTQSLLRKWLRDIHELHPVIIPTVHIAWTYKMINTGNEEIEVPPYEGVHAYDYGTYEEALEAALQEALKLI